ncbi:MAG: acetyl-CoA carboxylase biotin carboxyl carrier protein subunit [Cycloclasticus sp.]
MWSVAAILLSRTQGATGWRSTGVLSWPVRLKFQQTQQDFVVSQDGHQYCVEADGFETQDVIILNESEGELTLQVNGVRSSVTVALDEQQCLYIDNRSEVAMIEKLSFSNKRDEEELGANLVAPMSGRIADVKVKAGETVDKGDLLVVLESMKMFQELNAQKAGTVSEVYVAPDQQVDVGHPLIDVNADE